MISHTFSRIIDLYFQLRATVSRNFRRVINTTASIKAVRLRTNTLITITAAAISTVTSTTFTTTAATFTSIAGTFITATVNPDATPTTRNANAHYQCLTHRVASNNGIAAVTTTKL